MHATRREWDQERSNLEADIRSLKDRWGAVVVSHGCPGSASPFVAQRGKECDGSSSIHHCSFLPVSCAVLIRGWLFFSTRLTLKVQDERDELIREVDDLKQGLLRYEEENRQLQERLVVGRFARS